MHSADRLQAAKAAHKRQSKIITDLQAKLNLAHQTIETNERANAREVASLTTTIHELKDEITELKKELKKAKSSTTSTRRKRTTKSNVDESTTSIEDDS